MRHHEGHFRVGDLVTRDGTDVHRVTETNGTEDCPPDLIDVVCVKEPLGFLNEDGSRGDPWTRIGETETNLARRYSYVGDTINGDAHRVHLIGPAETSETPESPEKTGAI